MKESMLNLQDSLRGVALMSHELDEMFTSLLLLQVPTSWRHLSFLSIKPLAAWQADLTKRCE